MKGVNVIFTRSSKEVGTQDTPKIVGNPKDIDTTTPQEDREPPYQVRVPFPQALRPTIRAADPNCEILEHLKQVKINLPLLHVIKQVPTYAKILKDLCTIKRKHHVKKDCILDRAGKCSN